MNKQPDFTPWEPWAPLDPVELMPSGAYKKTVSGLASDSPMTCEAVHACITSNIIIVGLLESKTMRGEL